MGKSGNWYIASVYGADHTLYAAMRAMGIPLTPTQEKCQRELERMYPKKKVRRE